MPKNYCHVYAHYYLYISPPAVTHLAAATFQYLLPITIKKLKSQAVDCRFVSQAWSDVTALSFSGR